MNALTPRQNQIAELAALGVSNGDIASKLGVTSAVVRAELEALYRKLGDGRPHNGKGRLAPTHEQVATLAAAGRTTREIAEALSLSPKTVEGHPCGSIESSAFARAPSFRGNST